MTPRPVVTSTDNLPILSVHHLTIKTDSQMLVDALSFDLYRGETLAIVGESGSGKSISGLALLGLLPDNLSVQGDAIFQNNPLTDRLLKKEALDSLPLPIQQMPIQQRTNNTSNYYKRRESAIMPIRGAGIGMIFQEPMSALNPLHTVIKQLAESLTLAGVSKSQIKSQALQLLNDVAIKSPATKLHKYPHELSGGERQRVMIAIALAQNPYVLIADEPTTALDADLRVDILDLLDNLKTKRGMAMLLISHDLNLVRRYSQQIIIMQRGRTIEQGRSDAIFTTPQTAYTQALITQDYGKPLALIDERHDHTVNGTLSAIKVHQLSVKYPAKRTWFARTNPWTNIISNLNFRVEKGHCLGIIGESGSGKTTLALALTKLLGQKAKVSGDIVIDNTNINSLSRLELQGFRSIIQLVFQDPFASINPRFTVMQIVEEGLKVQGIPQSIRAQKVLQTLKTVHLSSDIITRYPHELSGGQRQRVALARALVMQPKVLVLDEPTSSLDSQTQVAIINLLRELQAKLGLNYIFISHDLKVVRALCQYIMVIKEGRCVDYVKNKAAFIRS